MTRKEANLEIARQLTHYLTMNPDQRFGQALRNVGIVVDRWNEETSTNDWLNGFMEEPQVTLERVKKTKQEQKTQK